MLTLSYFGASRVVVNSEARKRELTLFCEEKTWIAIDTETAPMNTGCDLVQIGNDVVVYLIDVNEHRQFLVGIATVLASQRHKTVFQFGPDDFQKFAQQIGVSCIVCNVTDVQLKNSSKEKLISLGDLYSKKVIQREIGS